ncbi:MAG: acyl-CoA dehydrogenase C-terminal domain-containing protein [Gammaproteobacteria bacterium]|nr:acyl-CoA dehydrogenase C-terminal domain-containing protein [Gammaproteobacteria bacterium]MCP5424617.1 acyl-CoA dehydrogenase C-terminal domain-containing protein [Gammaproteobacteria bacterium]
MTVYAAPTRDMLFVMTELAGLDEVAALPDYQELGVTDVAEAILEEANKFASEVLAPLNWGGDQQGARMENGQVISSPGFVDAYKNFAEGGWNGLSAPIEYDGQGLPELLNTPTYEMWNAANMSFALAPLLGAGATECIKHHGSDELKATYLPKMISGEWAGTMDLTEPAAGSDLSNVKCRAVPEGDHYLINGQKIFITWGDHDMTDNIIHLVLARLPDAPEGVKGISLFLMPKFLVNPDGSLGARNKVDCVGLEHKLGIHGSATCTLAYEDAVGYLVGNLNQGLMHMFTMMNEARLKVGIQGLAISERAYQAAVAYAKERVQGFAMKGTRGGSRVTIINHPDVRRMLMTMKSQIEAMRAFNYLIAMHMDMSAHHPDPEARKAYKTRLELLIPVTKAWCSELGIEIASIGVQVFGGMGFVEETGAAQHLRDARIATIYEGTTGIQAADLAGRKLVMDKGAAMASVIADMRAVEEQLAGASSDDLAAIRSSLGEGIKALSIGTEAMLAAMAQNPSAAIANSVNYLMLVGYVCGGWQMARAALVANQKLAAGEDTDFYQTKLITARFYADQILPKATALAQTVKAGGESTLALTEEQF